jgi:hypothetical protein
VLEGAAVAVVLVAATLVVGVLGGGGSSGSSGTTPSSPPTTATPAPAKPPPTTEAFGANVGQLFNDRDYTPAQVDAQLAALRRAGASVARADALWEWAEPAPPTDGVHHYDWSSDDTIASALASNHLQWLPIVDYSAPWAQSVSGQDHSPPSDPGDYAAYAAALARRYGPGGSFWSSHPGLTPDPVTTYEIWNEPDNPAFWSPKPNPSAYATLYEVARNAIDAAQPDARVLVGGLTHPASFLTDMLAAAPALKNQIDGVAIHPYGPSPNAVLASLRAARLALGSLGLPTVPLYVTEFGWTTSPRGALDWAPAAARPHYIESTLSALGHLDCGVAAALLYTWVTPERDPANAQDWFGISAPSAAPTPDTAMFAAGLHAATSAGPTLDLCA